MPRWKALPDELDPQIREFASQLRRLVDRGGLSVAALADRTGYSKTSWERYLNGRLLAPKGAVVALAEVTGTNPVHLTTMWELAERAWSRAELRHDRTMEAIRIAQARAELGELGAGSPGAEAGGGKPARRNGVATAEPGSAGPAGVSPAVPVQPTASDADAREGTARKAPPAPEDAVATAHLPATAPGPAAPGESPDLDPASGTRAGSAAGTTGATRSTGAGAGSAPGTQTSSGGNSWGLAGYQGPSRTGGRTPDVKAPAAGGAGPAAGLTSPQPVVSAGPYAQSDPGGPYTPASPGPQGEPPRSPRPASSGGGGRKRQVMMFLAGAASSLAVIGAVFLLTGGGDGKKAADAPKSPSPSADVSLPAGVKCVADGCTGKDAEAMGCSGNLVSTADSVTVGTTLLEVRYSRTCGAAWARITQAVQGDEVRVTVGARTERGALAADGETIAYTPMVAVRDAQQAKACATLASGQTGCTG
ncbi:helix-turn-helix domain-containing protein [Streptomyces sp. NPDC014889]|uniref:helix-turn-helix domain-containing protein n=1 Tax=Streptomyces sp. NPDC014889 TaxID=3364928 RepID=UPI0036F8C644